MNESRDRLSGLSFEGLWTTRFGPDVQAAMGALLADNTVQILSEPDSGPFHAELARTSGQMTLRLLDLGEHELARLELPKASENQDHITPEYLQKQADGTLHLEAFTAQRLATLLDLVSADR